MSDVTRYSLTLRSRRTDINDIGYLVGRIELPDGQYRREITPEYAPSKVGDLILHTDHLAALERVRVETLREARKAIDHIYPVSDQWGHHTLPYIDRRAARAAIDRLIDATTTGDTDA